MKKTAKPKSVRLPSFIIPERYTLELSPNLTAFTFGGLETIAIKLTKATKEIVLHARELQIQSAEVMYGKGRGAMLVDAATIFFDEKAETVTFAFAKKIPAGKIELHIEFTGILNDKLHGFYRSKYSIQKKDGKTEDAYLATTQFEATDARSAFPCIDEPARKAIFEVTLIAPTGMVAISNTNPVKIEEQDNGASYTFAPTPKMSTYLLAFIVGKFEYIETTSKEGVNVRVWTTPGKKEQGHFALDAASKTLSFYNDYFGIPYPLPIMQLIAIPDFSSAAMENWGAVTYRESALLIEEEHASTMDKEWVAIVVAHELAHQWFGNLVTMEWWTDLWLNEGFARYMESVAVDAVFPEYDMWTRFTSHALGYAFRLDALKNTHPIEVPVNHPSEISEIFDGVSYEKGATVIRMLATYLGEAAFRKGLKQYLTKYKFGNTVTTDLWKSLESASRKPVGKIMKAWTGKPGYPYLTLEEKRNALSIRQARFFSDAASLKNSRDTTVWQIPVGVEGGDATRLMTGKSLSLSGLHTTLKQGAKFNMGETTLARIRYPDSWYPILERRIAAGAFKSPDRLGIIRDTFAFTEAGILPTDTALRFAKSYKSENDHDVWSALAASITQIGNLMFATPEYEAYRTFARSMFVEIVRKVGWEAKQNERHTETLMRVLALHAFGAYGDKETIRIAQEKFRAFMSEKKDIDPNLRDVVYDLVAKYGDTQDHQLFIELYKAARLPQEQERYGSALESFRDANLLAGTLEFAFSPDVRPQDAPFMVAGVGMNPYGRELMWKTVQKRWPKILEQYGSGDHLLLRFIAPLSGFTDLAHAKEIEQFFKKNKAPGAERTIKQTLERIRSNAGWLKRDYKKIAKFLETYDPMV